MNSNERHNMSSSTEQGNQRKEEKMMSTSHLKPTVSKKGKAMTVSPTKQRKQRKEENVMTTPHLDEHTLQWLEECVETGKMTREALQRLKSNL